MNHKWAAIFLAVASLMLLCYAKQNAPEKPNAAEVKVSDAQSVRILKIQLDIKNLEQQGQQLAQQQRHVYETYQHDQKELDAVKADALKEAGKSPAYWDIDANLKFVVKQKVAKK